MARIEELAGITATEINAHITARLDRKARELERKARQLAGLNVGPRYARQAARARMEVNRWKGRA